jgi:hypothetical protein
MPAIQITKQFTEGPLNGNFVTEAIDTLYPEVFAPGSTGIDYITETSYIITDSKIITNHKDK